MKQYLLRADNTFSDYADYAVTEPFPAPPGAQWKIGEPTGLAKFNDIALIDRMANLLKDMPAQELATYAPLIGADLLIKYGRLDALEIAISVDAKPEHKEFKDKVLEEIQREKAKGER